MATSAQSVGHASARYASNAVVTGFVCVIFSMMSARAPSSIASEMNVCLIPWSRLRGSPRRLQSACSDWTTLVTSRVSHFVFGTIRSSGVGRRPYCACHPESFHSPRMAASVGCTGTSRAAFVLVSFSSLWRDDQARSTERHPSGWRAGS